MTATVAAVQGEAPSFYEDTGCEKWHQLPEDTGSTLWTDELEMVFEMIPVNPLIDKFGN